MPSPQGEFALDTKDGLRHGGAVGVAIVPGKPESSPLLKALRYTDTDLQMPPSGKLPDAVVADFEQWISAGAPDPRIDAAAAPSGSALNGMSVEDGRKWWAFQPLAVGTLPLAQDVSGVKSAIDLFVIDKLRQHGLSLSPVADPRTLVRRVYVDLVGYKPTYEEIEAFIGNSSPLAYENLVDQLLASPQYGERWGRHWMDVARYGEDNPTGEATNPAYRFA